MPSARRRMRSKPCRGRASLPARQPGSFIAEAQVAAAAKFMPPPIQYPVIFAIVGLGKLYRRSYDLPEIASYFFCASMLARSLSNLEIRRRHKACTSATDHHRAIVGSLRIPSAIHEPGSHMSDETALSLRGY